MRFSVRSLAPLLASLALVVASTRAQSLPVLAQALPDIAITQAQAIDLRGHFGVSGVPADATVAQFTTSVGKINLLLLPGDAPATVQNFLTYLNAGAYTNSIIHRSVPGFIVQGGGFKAAYPVVTIAQNPAVVNEYKLSNTRGTIAMAKLGSNPNSATNQWFFNLANNAANLDNQNGGFTVFGRVIGTGMTVVDAIAAVPIWTATTLHAAFTDLPLINYANGQAFNASYYMTISEIVAVPVFPATNAQTAVLRFELTGGNPALATATLNGGTLTVTPVAGAHGTTNLTVKTIDTDGNSATDTFAVTVGFGITKQPVDVVVPVGQPATFTVETGAATGLAYQWFFGNQEIGGATQASYTVLSAQPWNVGLYSVRVSAPGYEPAYSHTALLGVQTSAKVAGAGAEVGANITHPNGNVYDQVLLQGSAAVVTADAGQVTRISFIDLSDDIVQVEFSGPGSLTVSLENATGPALPVNYNQAVSYMRGHATLTIVGAAANTHVSAFTVGTATAVNQALFKQGVSYDGVADIALLSIKSADGRFGGVRMANTEFMSTHGTIGLSAPGVGFAGPINLHNVGASDQAYPLLLTGMIDTGQIGITGGDMRQANNRAVTLESAQVIRMLAGATSHGVAQPAKTNQARYERNGTDVTAQVVQGP